MKVQKQKLDKSALKFVSRIGLNIRKIRKRAGDTQERLAEGADINAKHLSAIENGKEPNLSIRYLMAMAMALETDLAEFLAEN